MGHGYSVDKVVRIVGDSGHRTWRRARDRSLGEGPEMFVKEQPESN